MITSASGAAASRLGLAAGPQQDPRCVRHGASGGINYFFFYGPGYAPFIEQVALLARQRRDQIIIASGSGGRKRASLLAVRKKIFTALNTTYLDVFFSEYVMPADDLKSIFGHGGVLDELQDWKAAGCIRYVGVTTHDRTLARQLAQDPRVDILMHRYNMAHRKAAAEVFPAAIQSKTPVVAFTATRWGTLLQSPDQWPDKQIGSA